MSGQQDGRAGTSARAGTSSRMGTRAAAVIRGRQAAATRLSGSGAGHLWRRLTALDFINRAMLFAAVLFLCAVPFVIVLEAMLGKSATTRTIQRFGLNHDAATAVSQIFTSPAATSSTISGTSYLWFVLGGLAGATAVQELYEVAYELPGRGWKDVPRRLVWLACAVGSVLIANRIGPWLHDAGGPVLLLVAALVALAGFWWFSIWLLLGGRRGWLELLPAALATSFCWTGMMVVFRFVMSDSIISNYRKYGAIGVIFTGMSFLIAIGVVIILGAIFGVVWREERRNRLATPAPADPAPDSAIAD